MLKFKKHSRKNDTHWDAPADNGFYRIVVNNSGFYVVYHCKGLEANGVTPVGMTELFRSLFMKPCKQAAERHYLKQRAADKQRASNPCGCLIYEGSRLPYKED